MSNPHKQAADRRLEQLAIIANSIDPQDLWTVAACMVVNDHVRRFGTDPDQKTVHHGVGEMLYHAAHAATPNNVEHVVESINLIKQQFGLS